MRITDHGAQTIPAVYLGLSDDEADELIDALRDLKTAAKGWHAHITDSKYGWEVTVYREDDDTARIYD
jgi:hypothetical protein